MNYIARAKRGHILLVRDEESLTNDLVMGMLPDNINLMWNITFVRLLVESGSPS